MKRCRVPSWLILGLLVVLGSVDEPCLADEAQDSGPWDGEFLQELVGSWSGVGTVYGNPVTLGRVWSMELAGQFLRADMTVNMSNGLSFRALMFWQKAGPGRYGARWMDEIGTSQSMEGVGDPARKEVVLHRLDEGDDGEPTWQRFVFRVLGPDAYVESLYEERGERWEQVGEFTFSRKDTSQP